MWSARAVLATPHFWDNELASTLTRMTAISNLAFTYLEYVMMACKRVLGDEYPDTLCSMDNLASTIGYQGRWEVLGYAGHTCT